MIRSSTQMIFPEPLFTKLKSISYSVKPFVPFVLRLETKIPTNYWLEETISGEDIQFYKGKRRIINYKELNGDLLVSRTDSHPCLCYCHRKEYMQGVVLLNPCHKVLPCLPSQSDRHQRIWPAHYEKKKEIFTNIVVVHNEPSFKQHKTSILQNQKWIPFLRQVGKWHQEKVFYMPILFSVSPFVCEAM